MRSDAAVSLLTLSPETWVALTAALVAVSCGLIGVFLLLKKNVMLGDGISHAALPGIALAFLFSGTREPFTMLFGATALGLVTAFCTESLQRTGRVASDASLGIVFTFLFAVGVVMISLFAGRIDLDLDCVLYGEIAYTPWDRVVWGGADLGPRAFLTLAGTLTVVVLFIILCYRQLKITIFDPQLADALGINSRLYHYLLMTVVSLTVVAAFEAVGAILVVAMLVAPGAIAYLISNRLNVILALTVVIGAAAALSGYLLAQALNVSISGSIATVCGVLFTIALLISPHRART
ncbi:MAG TPA: metal ABC transporter permease [candidate division Zixibacteria bacterium]|nr:metal ABC transporter permease [candidate division Zixibacteria bacterium]